ncbi:MAG: DUF2141 domain-containing protein [Rhodovibrionaceae bacterium]
MFLKPRSRTRRSPLSLAGAAIFTLCLAALAPAAADSGRVERTLAKANPSEQVETCSEQPRHIRILVEDVREERGVITADLHDDDPDNWLVGKKKVDRERWTARPGTTEICFTVEETGTYAIALYHDLDASGRLETSMLGIPVEPFGISNNPIIMLSPPSLGEAAFEVPHDGVSLTIQLKHGFLDGKPGRSQQK